MFASLMAVTFGSNPLVTFVIVAVLVAVALYYIPRLITMDAKVWQIVRVVVIIALVLWALQLFGVI
jgi:hypothetical protein